MDENQSNQEPSHSGWDDWVTKKNQNSIIWHITGIKEGKLWQMWLHDLKTSLEKNENQKIERD